MSGSGFGDLLVEEIPRLRAYAFSLSRSYAVADDLVQETLVKAWKSRASFEEGSNLRAWLMTILRNTHFTQHRRTKIEVLDADGIHANGMSVEGEQFFSVELRQVHAAIDRLPPDLREIILLTCLGELTYDEAAQVLNMPMGTVKSRLNRARAKLAELLEIKQTSCKIEA
jgi:RNA polymerase sigma-70 factor, ECF subfamily